mmetsp:Transcript_15236/g.34115  ORF Transcript_15236/g.34115 Transcript_15236/m.34115 type:complete len:265 (-) Transcript_15236:9255-10049(-)
MHSSFFSAHSSNRRFTEATFLVMRSINTDSKCCVSKSLRTVLDFEACQEMMSSRKISEKTGSISSIFFLHGRSNISHSRHKSSLCHERANCRFNISCHAKGHRVGSLQQPLVVVHKPEIRRVDLCIFHVEDKFVWATFCSIHRILQKGTCSSMTCKRLSKGKDCIWHLKSVLYKILQNGIRHNIGTYFIKDNALYFFLYTSFFFIDTFVITVAVLEFVSCRFITNFFLLILTTTTCCLIISFRSSGSELICHLFIEKCVWFIWI